MSCNVGTYRRHDKSTDEHSWIKVDVDTFDTIVYGLPGKLIKVVWACHCGAFKKTYNKVR